MLRRRGEVFLAATVQYTFGGAAGMAWNEESIVNHNNSTEPHIGPSKQWKRTRVAGSVRTVWTLRIHILATLGTLILVVW
jgi:hypothetical protein